MSIGFGIDTEGLSAAAFEEQFERAIPCVGCGKPAELKSEGHGCNTRYRCIRCWKRWVQQELDRNALCGRSHFVCCHCERHFPTIESFSDYRPF